METAMILVDVLTAVAVSVLLIGVLLCAAHAILKTKGYLRHREDKRSTK